MIREEWKTKQNFANGNLQPECFRFEPQEFKNSYISIDEAIIIVFWEYFQGVNS